MPVERLQRRSDSSLEQVFPLTRACSGGFCRLRQLAGSVFKHGVGRAAMHV